jgi:hypothetical protein
MPTGRCRGRLWGLCPLWVHCACDFQLSSCEDIEILDGSVKDLEKGPSHASVEGVQLGTDEEVGSVADVQGLGSDFEVRRG